MRTRAKAKWRGNKTHGWERNMSCIPHLKLPNTTLEASEYNVRVGEYKLPNAGGLVAEDNGDHSIYMVLHVSFFLVFSAYLALYLSKSLHAGVPISTRERLGLRHHQITVHECKQITRLKSKLSSKETVHCVLLFSTFHHHQSSVSDGFQLRNSPSWI